MHWRTPPINPGLSLGFGGRRKQKRGRCESALIRKLSTDRPKESKPRRPFGTGAVANLHSYFFVFAKRLIVKDIQCSLGNRPNGIANASKSVWTWTECGTDRRLRDEPPLWFRTPESHVGTRNLNRSREHLCLGALTMKYPFLLSALLLLPASSVVAAGDSAPVPTAEEIVTRLGSHDLQRQASVEGYAGMRRYVLENRHFNKRAEMLVQVQGDRDGTKHFE